MSVNKNFYNEASASKLGWDPSWFGEDEFDDELVQAIENFQTKHDLEADGLCGPMTYRRALTEREALEAMALNKYQSLIGQDVKTITCNGRSVEIEWDKVVRLNDDNNLALPSDCYRSCLDAEREPSMIVTHWDAALSAKSCHNILKKRGISTHFVIDNDGTIYQMVDTQHVGWHAGNRGVNNCSIGIDFSNAYYVKYQKYYETKGFGPRPVLDDSTVHGRTLKPHLGYYPAQLEAYKALVCALCDRYDIPLACPTDNDGKLLTSVHSEAAEATFKGIVSHYHLTKRKIDCAGLRLDKVIDELRD